MIRLYNHSRNIYPTPNILECIGEFVLKEKLRTSRPDYKRTPRSYLHCVFLRIENLQNI